MTVARRVRRWTLYLIFFSLLGLAGYFGLQTMHHAAEWRNHKEEPVRGWMSIGYISHCYHIPKDNLYKALSLTPRERDRRTLRSIARTQKRPLKQVLSEVEFAILQTRQSNEAAP